MEMADNLVNMMAKDKDFLNAWSDFCDEEDFKYLLKQVWGQKKIIAAYYFGVFIISDCVEGQWIIVLLSPDGTEKIGKYGTEDYISSSSLKDFGRWIYEDWKEMEKAGHTVRNFNYGSKYFEETNISPESVRSKA